MAERMEQKQLDEIGQSFEGEEFIDELEQIKVEPASRRGRKAAAAKPSKKAKAEKRDELFAEEKKVEEKKTEPVPLAGPWTEQKSEPGLFSDAATWKAITGILIVLLIFSVFTQGFRFSGGISGAAAVPIQEAETKALNFVNTNLLQPPFSAEVTKSEEAGSLYKLTLAVAGQEIDSYITKDAKLFFPQGFDTTKSLQEQLADKTKASVAGKQPPSTLSTEEGEGQLEEIEETPALPEAEGREVENVLVIPVLAKKWLFQPNKITVKKGETVQLNIVSSFPFTFALPGYGIGREITGPTTIEFKADKAGRFPFFCSSCEEFRGMNGMLTVE